VLLGGPMTRVLVPLAEGFEEIETSTIVDVLRRGGVDVVLAGLAGGGPVKGSRGIVFTPDTAFDPFDRRFDLVVLPGGMGGAQRLAASEPMKALLRARCQAGEPVAALCAAPMALDAAGVLKPGAYTCYPGIEAKIGTPGRRDDVVVDVDGVITSQGPGTAMAFALHLVARLEGAAKRDSVADGLLYGVA